MRIKISGLAKISVKEITKLEGTSLSDSGFTRKDRKKSESFHGLFVPLRRHDWKCEKYIPVSVQNREKTFTFLWFCVTLFICAKR